MNFGYGNGWTMNYNVLYENLNDTIIVHREDGRRDTFLLLGGAYHAPVGVFDTLIEYQSDKYQLRSKYGTKRYFEDATHKRMTKMIDRHWNTLTITYTNGLPVMVTDATGRILQFTFTDGLLSQISDNNISSGRTLSYAYDARENMTGASDPQGHTTHYAYDINRSMLQLKNRKGQYYDIEYYDYGRVKGISSELTDIEMAYLHSSDQTMVTNTVGGTNQVSSFDFDSQGRNTKMANNCCGYDIDYTYDGDNNINSREDARNFTSDFVADGNGNYLTTTDPTGGSVQKSYDPTFNLLTQIVDKLGNITIISRDTSGNAIQINEPLGKTSLNKYGATGLLDSTISANGDTTVFWYDSNGYLEEIRRPIGISYFESDGAGRMLYSVAPQGDTTHYTYNLNNWITAITDPEGNELTMNHDELGNIIKTINARGFSTIVQYNALQQAIKITDANGNSRLSEYDAMGNVTKITDPMGNSTSYGYSNRNLLETITNALGNTMQFTHDANGNVLTQTDFNGNVTTMEYDTLNRMKKVVDPLGKETHYQYDLNGNLKRITDARASETKYQYDDLNRLVQTIYPIGQDSLIYDLVGNITVYINPNNHATSYYYNKMNWLDSIMDPMGFVTKYLYNLNGSLLSTLDPNKHNTQYARDELDRILHVTNAEGEVTSFTYNSTGNVETVSYPNGNNATAIYDALDRVIHTYDLLGPVSYQNYDENSRLIESRDANNNSVGYSYDDLNRLVTIQDALNNSFSISYDPNSNLVEQTDRNGKITKYEYDPMNRLNITINALLDTTWTYHDELGNVDSLMDASNNVTSYEYDPLNRIVSETYADNTTKEFMYDDAGNLTSRIDNNGAVTTYAYDDNGRLVLRDYPDNNDDIFTWDSAGRMVSATNNYAFITYTYDAVNRMLSENLNSRLTVYQYDVVNRKRAITYPSGRIIEEEMDMRDRMYQIKEGTDILASYNYDPAGRLVRRDYPQNATFSEYSYNANNWVTQLTHGPGSFIDFAYTFDNEGNRISEEHLHQPGNSMLAAYDDIYRLVDYKRGQLVANTIPASALHQVFNYDELGNRTTVIENGSSTSYSDNNMNEYTSIAGGGTVYPAYDDNGNMLTDGTFSYSYDFENRMDSVDDGIIAQYSYDPLGRRISKIAGGNTINYYYDGQRVVEEQDGSGSSNATYVFGSWIDDVLNMNRGSNEYFYHHNSLGSVAAVSNDTGSPQEYYHYDAYGQIDFSDQGMNSLSNSAFGNDYTFTGRRYDEETGKYFYRSRHNDPLYGRFMQRDPLAYIDGMNMYDYVLSNPINYIDPNGEVAIVNEYPDRIEVVLNFAIDVKTGQRLKNEKILERLQSGIEYLNRFQSPLLSGANQFIYNLEDNEFCWSCQPDERAKPVIFKLGSVRFLQPGQKINKSTENKLNIWKNRTPMQDPRPPKLRSGPNPRNRNGGRAFVIDNQFMNVRWREFSKTNDRYVKTTAHEFLHLMGVDDEYVEPRPGQCKPGSVTRYLPDGSTEEFTPKCRRAIPENGLMNTGLSIMPRYMETLLNSQVNQYIIQVPIPTGAPGVPSNNYMPVRIR